jgi:hypothetical protein
MFLFFEIYIYRKINVVVYRFANIEKAIKDYPLARRILGIS